MSHLLSLIVVLPFALSLFSRTGDAERLNHDGPVPRARETRPNLAKRERRAEQAGDQYDGFTRADFRDPHCLRRGERQAEGAHAVRRD